MCLLARRNGQIEIARKSPSPRSQRLASPPATSPQLPQEKNRDEVVGQDGFAHTLGESVGNPRRRGGADEQIRSPNGAAKGLRNAPREPVRFWREYERPMSFQTDGDVICFWGWPMFGPQPRTFPSVAAAHFATGLLSKAAIIAGGVYLYKQHKDKKRAERTSEHHRYTDAVDQNTQDYQPPKYNDYPSDHKSQPQVDYARKSNPSYETMSNANMSGAKY
ncbi:uncharacterized protein PV09_02978 [Verruconis gallopava]|uniref:Uncharacterized protein n=1 Tax=Verruconis gallopava TaxID=253628 RepID=A0A0D2AI73_9PEZI|nr:uncharacterized protein PV09_02978 [Verruconis gallopava]KIW06548.1 hypothetical protein PV09_02978 [Verruconis gallopava]